MDFTLSDRETHFRDLVRSFIDERIRPRHVDYIAQLHEGDRWKVLPVIEELKPAARAAGLWNLFMPPHSGHAQVDDSFVFEGTQLSNLEYALCAEEMGRLGWSAEVFNCSAPDTGNMEVLHRYGTRAQKDRWLKPLMDGEIRSAFLMTEPDVASSDATNIQTSIVRDGDDYVINGRKWWSSGTGDPRCAIAIVMGKSDPGGSRHGSQSQVLVPLDATGVRIERMLSVYGYDHAPHGHGEVVLENVRVPAGTSSSARAAASRSRKAGSDRGASTTACAPSAWPKWRWKPWPNASSPASLSASASRTTACGRNASPAPASTSR